MRAIYYFFFIFIVFSCNNKNEDKRVTKINTTSIIIEKKYTYTSTDALNVLTKKITDAELFISKNKNYNERIAFFIDMRIPSNEFRFFVVDMLSKVVLEKGLVAHGFGSNVNGNGEMKFSNEAGSLCTSLGLYTIGGYYYGQFGKSYKLYGQEKSNSNAKERLIVLHKHVSVPDTEQTVPIHNSFGCPMVSSKFFGQLEEIIDRSTKKIVLMIYN